MFLAVESLCGGTVTEGYETHLGLTLQVLLALSSAAKPKECYMAEEMVVSPAQLLKHNKLYLMLPFTISMYFLKRKKERKKKIKKEKRKKQNVHPILAMNR